MTLTDEHRGLCSRLSYSTYREMGTQVGIKMFEIPEKALEGPSAELFRLI